MDKQELESPPYQRVCQYLTMYRAIGSETQETVLETILK